MSFASGAKAFASLRGAGALAAKAHISRSEEQFAVVAPRSEIEQSLQARFLIPMAISLAFGVLFSTFVILILTPVLYVILEDFKGIFGRKTEKIFSSIFAIYSSFQMMLHQKSAYKFHRKCKKNVKLISKL